MHLRNHFQTIHWALLRTFYQSSWICMVNGKLPFQNPTHQSTKMYRRVKLCFLRRNFQSRQTSTVWNLVFSLSLRISLKPWTLSFKKDTTTAKIVSEVKVSRRRQKVKINLANERSVPAFFSADLGHIFGSNVGNQIGVILRRKGPHKQEFAYDIVRIHSLMIYTDLIEYEIVGDTKVPLLRCFPFFRSSRLETS